MKTYKGMRSDMTCRGFQYEPGGEYEMEGEIKLCKRGFHGCEMPLDVLRYYRPDENNRYFEVEQSGEIAKDGLDSKIASSKIQIGEEIDLSDLIKAQRKWAVAKFSTEDTNTEYLAVNDGNICAAGTRGLSLVKSALGVAAAGQYATAVTNSNSVSAVSDDGTAVSGILGVSASGNRSISVANHHGVSASGYFGISITSGKGVATAGELGIALTDRHGVSATGDGGYAASGSFGISVAGDYGNAVANSYGIAVSRGDASVGENGVACVRGKKVRIRGGIGALLLIGVEAEDSYEIKEWRAFVVDGEKIKADTWYTLEKGCLKEVKFAK